MPRAAVGGAGGLMFADHLVIALYLAAMLAMGLRIARRQISTEDFFLGGRTLPSWAVGISLIASLFSTITYLGMPGEMFRTGAGFLVRELGVVLVLGVVWFVWIPFFKRLNLTSAYEYLEYRFNYPTRALAAVFCILLLCGWMAVVVLTASKAMAEIARLDLEWFFGRNTAAFRDADMHALILSIGLFSVVYTTLGGLRAVVWTDVAQFFILMAGAFVTMGVVAWHTGSGLGDWLATARQTRYETVEWFSTDVGNRSTVFAIALGMFFWHLCTHGANQVTLQRYFAVPDVWAARRSFLVNALCTIGLGVLLAGVGISLVHFVRHHDAADLPGAVHLESTDRTLRTESQDRIFPQFIASRYFPAGLRGLVVAALFAAAMSTIDSGANSISTIVTIDFVRRWRRRDPTAADELRIARALTGGMGVVLVAATLFLYHVSKGTDFITLTQKGFNCFLGPLGALFVLAMFSRWVTPASAIPAVLLGEAVGIAASYSVELFDVKFSTHYVVAASWLATVVAAHLLALAFAAVSRLLGAPVPRAPRRWMWRAVVRGRTTEERPATS